MIKSQAWAVQLYTIRREPDCILKQWTYKVTTYPSISMTLQASYQENRISKSQLLCHFVQALGHNDTYVLHYLTTIFDSAVVVILMFITTMMISIEGFK
jgi:hypothetical protein